MKLTDADRVLVQRVLDTPDLNLNALTEMLGLDKRFDFVGADCCGIDFGTSDVAFFNFSQADLRGADLTRASGKDCLILTDAITDITTRGLPEPWRLREGPAPEMVRIPAGRFRMGATTREHRREKVPAEYAKWETPRRAITIAKPFWLAKHPVIVGQFAAFVDATGHRVPKGAWTYQPAAKGEWHGGLGEDRSWRDPGFSQSADHPVVCVGYDDAMAYVTWLRRETGQPYRLPSEAEWEYAARGGTETARFWGDDRGQAHRFANVADESLMAAQRVEFDADRFFPGNDGHVFTAPVCCYPPNPFGLYDMLGQAWEWCADVWTDRLTKLPEDGAPNTIGDSSRRSLRGGSWNGNPGDVRAASRVRNDTGNRNTYTGFRVART